MPELATSRRHAPRGVVRRALTALGLLAAVLAAALAAGTVIASPAAAATGPGTVYVLHGVAGTTVQVLVDGRTVARDVATKTVVGPLELAPGRHTVRMEAGSEPIAEASFEVTSGSSTDLVAHRFPDADRQPAFTVHRNDLSAVGPGKTRLSVTHTAVVPPADIVVDGSVLVSNIANGESSTKVVPAGSYEVAIVPTATDDDPVLGPTTLKVEPATLTNVFAIGDPAAGTMDAIVQSLRVATAGSGAPSAVNTGDGGQAAALVGDPAALGTGRAVTLVAVLAAAGLLLARVRRRTASVRR